jgi:hypothetical protein
MKKVLILAFVIATQVTLAQVKKNLGEFNTASVFDKLNVELIASSENKISISGSRANEVETVNKNGDLKLRMPFPKLLSGDDISIKLYFKSIDGIAANEGSFVSCKTVLKGTILDFSAREGAQIDIDVNAKKVNVKAVTGGIIEISGEAVNQDATLMSGGILKAKGLHTSQTTISVAAGGKAEIYATTLVDAKVKAGGSIFIYGKPEQINKETLLGGTIEEKQ